MKILWFTWKDRENPASGGAEVVNEEIAKRLARDGHEVIFLVGGFKGSPIEEQIDGYRVVRLVTGGVYIGRPIATTRITCAVGRIW